MRKQAVSVKMMEMCMHCRSMCMSFSMPNPICSPSQSCYSVP